VEVRIEEPSEVKPIGIVLAMDSSGSMEVSTPTTDIGRHRITAAKEFVNKLNNGKDKVGFVSWNGCGIIGNYFRACDTPSYTVTLDQYMTSAEFEAMRGTEARNKLAINPIQFVEPISSDLNMISTAIDSANSNGATNPDLGLKVAMALLDQAVADGTLGPNDEKVILFLADGRPMGGSNNSTYNGGANALTDIGSTCSNTLSPAFEAKTKGYIIYTVGLLGGDMRAEDEAKMTRWANCTGGTHMSAQNAFSLSSVFDNVYKKVETLVSYKTVCG
jgi:hypothetical protein